MAAPEQAVVCVLGMSRSGTSLTTKLVGIGGVYLGAEEDLLMPSRANPDGHWEHLSFLFLNELILKALGGTWRDPPDLPPGWEESPELEEWREAAGRLIQGFEGHEAWGWKDPRNCLTLPFWQRFLPRMRYVVCLRNPLDVAASLRSRNDMPAAEAYDLWRRYTAAGLAHTAGGPRLVVSYEDYFEQGWQAQAGRLIRFLGGPETLDPELERRLGEAIDAGHRHHRGTREELAGDAGVPPEVVSLYDEALRCDRAR